MFRSTRINTFPRSPHPPLYALRKRSAEAQLTAAVTGTECDEAQALRASVRHTTGDQTDARSHTRAKIGGRSFNFINLCLAGTNLRIGLHSGNVV